MKNIYIDSLPTEMSSGRHILNNNTLPSSESTTLEQIFLDETPNEDFPGFELSLRQIFLNETPIEDFLGFDLSLNHIFLEKTSHEEFLGF